MLSIKTRALGFAVVLFFLCLMQACQTKNPLGFPTEPVEGKIFFHIGRELPDDQVEGTPRMMLKMRSEIEYPCFNYILATRIARTGDKVLVFLSHVYVGDICLTAFGPARFEAPLDLKNGTYSLIISNRDFDDRYEISISGSSVAIIEKESHFTIPQQVWYSPPSS